MASLRQFFSRLKTRQSKRQTDDRADTVIANNTNQVSILNNNRNVNVQDSTFNVINTASPDAGSWIREGFLILAKAASEHAMHDSSARSPPPKCHPETRRKVVEFFLDWIKTQHPSTLVYWLHSPFGHGKSALMQTIIDRLIEEDCRQYFAGSFFFGRDKPGRDKIAYLFATIAYQIASNIPGMKEHINSAMLADPTLPSKSAEIQLRFLIINPLLNCDKGPHFHHSPTVFIDGLDECDIIDFQITILNLIASALHDHHIRLRFLIASRPEGHIRDCFDQPPLSDISERVQLPDNDAEMSAYLRAAFNKICTTHSRILRLAEVEMPWPTDAVISELVRRASGQYVFLDTVLRFVGAHRSSPVSQLNIVLRRLSDESVFTDMDTIYRLILEQCPIPYRHIQRRIIFSLLINREHLSKETDIADIWQLPVDEVHVVVETLAAVLDRDPVGKLSFHHLSFKEFLGEKSRSRTFFCNKSLASKRVGNRLRKVFKLVLSRRLILRQWNSLVVIVMIGERPLDWLTPSQVLELLQQGQSLEIGHADAFFQWYFMVEHITSSTGGWLEKHCCEAVDNETEAIMDLHSRCVGVWKNIAQRELAGLDLRLVNALMEARPMHRIGVPKLAEEARMDKNACMQQLREHKVLFVNFHDEDIKPDDFINLRDHWCLLFDENTKHRRVRDFRKEFYSN